MHQDDDVEIQEQETCFQGFFKMERLRLRHRRFAGGWTPSLVREVLVPRPAVAVLPYDPVRDEVVLIEQFRTGALAAGEDAWMTEIVAGLVDEGEEPEAVARRETMEETGLTVSRLEPIAKFMPSPGGSAEVVRIYIGRVDATGAGGIHGAEHEGEDIRVFRLSGPAAIDLLDSGEVENSITLIGLHWFARHRDAIHRRWR